MDFSAISPVNLNGSIRHGQLHWAEFVYLGRLGRACVMIWTLGTYLGYSDHLAQTLGVKGRRSTQVSMDTIRAWVNNGKGGLERQRAAFSIQTNHRTIPRFS